jgi:hypothetical protein
MKKQAALFILTSLFAYPAAASSGDAWKEFAAEVQAKCLGAVSSTIEQAKVVVDPFGSESYGLAIVSGKAKGADAQVSQICVYDKTSKMVQIGSELSSDAVKIDIPAPAAR